MACPTSDRPPAAGVPVSTCRRAMAICSSENLLFFIDESSRPPKETTGWTRKASINARGSGPRIGDQSPKSSFSFDDIHHGVYPADVKQAFQVAAGQDLCRGMGKGRLLLISGLRCAVYGTETRMGDMAKGRRDCKRG